MQQLFINIIFSFLMYYIIIKLIKIDMERHGAKINYKLAIIIFLIVYSPFFAMIGVLAISGIRISAEVSYMLYIIALLVSGMVYYEVCRRKNLEHIK